MGKKYSKKRDEILRILRSSDSHPGAQWIYHQLKPSIPDLSLGTVYRNITLFRREGAVASLGVIAGEERFDGRVHPHPHLLCGSCGRILDLPVPDRELLERLAFYTNGEGTAGLSIDFRRTLFYGTCGECGAGNGGYEKTDRDKAPPGSGGS